MADNNSYKQPPRRRGPGGPGRGMMPAEKAKDFKGSIGKLIKYIGTYKICYGYGSSFNSIQCNRS